MGKKLRIAFLIVMAMVTMLCVGIVYASDEGTTTDGPLTPYEKNHEVKTVTPDMEIVQVDPDAEEIDLVKQETIDTVNEWAKTVLNSGPFEKEKIIAALNYSEGVAKGKSGFLAERNHTELVQVEQVGNANATDYIYVIDENAFLFVLKDGENSFVSDATVTISYIDENGNQITKSVKSSGDHVPGLAAFDGMKGFRYALVDIQKEGYKTITLLQEDITGGCSRTITMEKCADNELYVRCADLGGKDLLYSDTDLNLVKTASDKAALTIMFSKNGGIDETARYLELTSQTDGRLITYAYDKEQSHWSENSTYFYFEDYWLMQDKGLFKEGDVIELNTEGDHFILDRLIIKNALVEPSYTPNTEINISDTNMTANMDGAFPASGKFNFSANLLGFEVAAGIYPDGSFFIAGTYDVQGASKSLSTLFPKSSNPQVAQGTKKITDRIIQDVKDNWKKVKEGTGKIKGSSHETLVDTNKKFIGASFNLCFTGSYNQELKKYEGDISFAMSCSGSIGQSFYTAIIAGPVTIPIYMGYEFGLTVSTYSEWIFRTDSIFPMGSLEFADDKSVDFALHLLPSVELYVGAGIRGILGAEFNGNFGFDIAVAAAKWDSTTYKDRAFIDLMANLELKYYYLFGSGSIKLFPTDKKRLYDSWGKETQLLSPTGIYTDLTPIDISLYEENVSDKTTGEVSDGLGKLPTYKTSESEQLTVSTEVIDYYTLVDNQLKVICTKDYTVLFRIISESGKTKLVYQYMKPENGSFDATLYEVQMPEGESVFEYSASEIKGSGSHTNENYVYVAAVCGDISKTDMEERSYTTSVAGITLDLEANEEVYCKTLSPAENKGKVCYFNPLPAGYSKECLVAYSTAESYKTRDDYNNYMVNEEGQEVFMSANAPVFTTGQFSKCFWTTGTKKEEGVYYFRGFDYKGESPEDSRGYCVPLDVSDYNSDDCPISAMTYQKGNMFVIAKEKVYWLKPDNGDYSFTEIITRYCENADFNGSNTSYEMFSNPDKSLIYIVAATRVYETDEETLERTCTGTELKISFILAKNEEFNQPTLHGVRKCFIENGEMTQFSTGLSRCAAHNGLIAVYDQYETEAQTSNDVYLWREDAVNGYAVRDFSIFNPVVKNSEKYIAAEVTFQNDGYAVEYPIIFEITDESGTVLQQARYDSTTKKYEDMPIGSGYCINYFYPADTYSMNIYFKTNPNWETSKEHSINIRVVKPDSNEVDEGITHTFGSAYLNMTGKQSIVNNRHVAELTITNKSVVQGELPKFVIQGHYASGNLPTGQSLSSFSNVLGTVNKGNMTLLNRNVEAGRYTEQSYNLTLDLEDIWKNNTSKGLMGVYIMMVDENGEQVDKQKVYLENPYYEYEEKKPQPEPETTTEQKQETTAEQGQEKATEKSTERTTKASQQVTKKQETTTTIEGEPGIGGDEPVDSWETISEPKTNSGLSGWGIAGIVVGGLAVCGGGGYFVYRKYRK